MAQQLSRYYTYLEPVFKTPKSKAYTMLVFSLFAIAFFGIFAIRPTVITILKLQNDIKQAKEIDTKLSEKIDSLRRAEETLIALEPKEPLIAQAFPPNPYVALLLRTIETKAQAFGLKVGAIQVRTVSLAGQEAKASASSAAQLYSLEEFATSSVAAKPFSELKLSFTLTGQEAAIINYLHELAVTRRVINLETIRFVSNERDGNYTAEVGVIAYYAER